MAFKFAKRMERLQSSEVRELLKLTQKPEIISFAGGLPAPELFPVEELRLVADELLKQEGRQLLQYATTEGRPTLRKKVADRMKAKYYTNVSADEILITTGSQQCLDFAGKLFLDPGDVVLCESPSYLGALNAFAAYEPRFVEVPTDNGGLIPEELDKILATTERCKFIYVIPDFQNPTGRTWSMERREKFMEVVNKYELPVLEDNPYGELRFEGEIFPSLKSMDTKGLVMFLGTFSKIFCPGLRLGWVAAEPDVLSEFIKIKQSADLHTSNFDQALADVYMDKYDMDVHVEKIKDLYRHRRDLIIDSLEKFMPSDVEWTHPAGGLFLWLTFPSGVSAAKVFAKCIEKNVAGVTGDAFFPNGKTDKNMRINYSNMPDEKIVEGIKRMAEAIKELV
ncbi:MAG TPA: PLP-dependent aminotransferase family protein [Candidatus Avacidaminococcus intestinavium]|uniref:PLP-dependent aminotransferase family protein n=1 Tax=Candidatus Avacidaminococcus intestinavium TaxID=2840684 RepID=A0A9D1MQ96_9FIRM|nr:PLP-dependent aminotransferase family protein [Candidatus Avacidaminococcus intestinavium]